ncbi:hypothetical protein DFS07_13073, partial [Burkholderia cenocepacia]
EQVFADAGYIGVDKREEMAGKAVKWHVAARRGKIKAMQEGALKDLVIALEGPIRDFVGEAYDEV